MIGMVRIKVRIRIRIAGASVAGANLKCHGTKQNISQHTNKQVDNNVGNEDVEGAEVDDGGSGIATVSIPVVIPNPAALRLTDLQWEFKHTCLRNQGPTALNFN